MRDNKNSVNVNKVPVAFAPTQRKAKDASLENGADLALNNYQEMANNSRQVKQLQAIQTMANHYSLNKVSQRIKIVSPHASTSTQHTAVVQRVPFVNLKNEGGVDLGPKTAEELQKLLDGELYGSPEDKEIILQELENKKKSKSFFGRALDMATAGLRHADSAKKMIGNRDTDRAATSELINHDEQRAEKVEELATTGVKGAASAGLNLLTGGISGMVKSGADTAAKGSQTAEILAILSSARKNKVDALAAAHSEIETGVVEKIYPAAVLEALENIAKDSGTKTVGAALGFVPVVGSVAGLGVGALTDSSKDVEVLERFRDAGNDLAERALNALRPAEDRVIDATVRSGYTRARSDNRRRTTYGTFDL